MRRRSILEQGISVDAVAAIGPMQRHARRVLAANLAALRESRPEIYEELMGTESREGLSKGDSTATVRALAEIKEAWKSGSPLALCGIGDGGVLAALAGFSPVLPIGREQAVCVIEPRISNLWGALARRDLTGAIRAGRFAWFVGEGWAQRFEEGARDPFFAWPEVAVGQDAAIHAEMTRIAGELSEQDRKNAEIVSDYYGKVERGELAAAFCEKPARRPRVLLLTSRFTTVLQYSTADAAEGFRQLGWDTLVLMEPAPYRMLSSRAMRQAMAEFLPDFVFTIDHHRTEYGDIFPAQVPFACWIQDRLANLCTAEAAAGILPRDFVLTPSGAYYVRQWTYPARQIVDLPNLARVPVRPVSWEQDDLDLAYTSNWSKTTEDVIDEVLGQAREPKELRTIAEAACARIVGIFESGKYISTQWETRASVMTGQNDCGIAIADPRLMDELIALFWDRLVPHLYRHQGLQWVADLAEKRGLKLGLYGKGWDKHPRFAKFARGFIRPGEELEAMVRRTKLNLHVEPWACYTHARFLGGAFAGGFFLVRDNPFHHLPQKMLDFVKGNLDGEVETTDQAQGRISAQKRGEWEKLLEQCRALGEQSDAVGMARNWERAGLLPKVAYLDRVTFSNPLSLEARAMEFLNDPESRRTIARDQCVELEGRLGFAAGLRRMCGRIQAILRSETCG